MSAMLEPRAIGMPLARLDGEAKVTGTAPYAFEHPLRDPLYAYPLQAAIARGLECPGVRLIQRISLLRK